MLARATATRDDRTGTLVHLLTASGAIAGLVALQRVIDGDVRAALLWLIACQVLDGIDGPIARRYDAATKAPHIDGRTLDLVVDYVTCVVVPVELLIQLQLVPARWTTFFAGLILLTSALWFARSDQETSDSWFNGFPAMWNVVIPTFVLLGTGPRTTMAVALLFCALQLTDLKFPHLVRVQALRWLTLSLTAVYLLAFVWMSAVYPDGPAWAMAIMLIGPAYAAALVCWRTVAPHRTFFGHAII